MGRRSGGHHMSHGRWWEHSEGPSLLAEPQPRTPMCNRPDPLASRYPTLAEISMQARQGSGMTHGELMQLIGIQLDYAAEIVPCA